LASLEKEDGTYTTDTKSTLMHMLEHFVPDDRGDSDNELHRKIRKEIQESIDTADDKDFTKKEIIANLKKNSTRKMLLERMV
jgi:DNA-binding transcriptional regulator YhcF (GntR family)